MQKSQIALKKDYSKWASMV